MFVVFAAAHVSAQQALPGQDVKSLAGKWVGWVTPATGSNFVAEVDLQPDGSYTSLMGADIGKGTIKMDGGKLVAEGHLVTGTAGATVGVGKSQITLSSKNGKQMMSGSGRNDRGPFSYQLTKQQ